MHPDIQDNQQQHDSQPPQNPRIDDLPDLIKAVQAITKVASQKKSKQSNPTGVSHTTGLSPANSERPSASSHKSSSESHSHSRTPRASRDSRTGPRTEEIAILLKSLAEEERKTATLQQSLLSTQASLQAEADRADAAHARVRELKEKNREAVSANRSLEADLMKHREQLRWTQEKYDVAAKEVERAQREIDSVEEERYRAERVAKEAREKARELMELIKLREAAKEGFEEGMKRGLKEGLEAGKEEGMKAGVKTGRKRESSRHVNAIKRLLDSDVLLEDPTNVTPIIPAAPLALPSAETRSIVDASGHVILQEALDHRDPDRRRISAPPPVQPTSRTRHGDNRFYSTPSPIHVMSPHEATNYAANRYSAPPPIRPNSATRDPHIHNHMATHTGHIAGGAIGRPGSAVVSRPPSASQMRRNVNNNTPVNHPPGRRGRSGTTTSASTRAKSTPFSQIDLLEGEYDEDPNVDDYIHHEYEDDRRKRRVRSGSAGAGGGIAVELSPIPEGGSIVAPSPIAIPNNVSPIKGHGSNISLGDPGSKSRSNLNPVPAYSPQSITKSLPKSTKSAKTPSFNATPAIIPSPPGSPRLSPSPYGRSEHKASPHPSHKSATNRTVNSLRSEGTKNSSPRPPAPEIDIVPGTPPVDPELEQHASHRRSPRNQRRSPLSYTNGVTSGGHHREESVGERIRRLQTPYPERDDVGGEYSSEEEETHNNHPRSRADSRTGHGEATPVEMPPLKMPTPRLSKRAFDSVLSADGGGSDDFGERKLRDVELHDSNRLRDSDIYVDPKLSQPETIVVFEDTPDFKKQSIGGQKGQNGVGLGIGSLKSDGSGMMNKAGAKKAKEAKARKQSIAAGASPFSPRYETAPPPPIAKSPRMVPGAGSKGHSGREQHLSSIGAALMGNYVAAPPPNGIHTPGTNHNPPSLPSKSPWMTAKNFPPTSTSIGSVRARSKSINEPLSHKQSTESAKIRKAIADDLDVPLTRPGGTLSPASSRSRTPSFGHGDGGMQSEDVVNRLEHQANGYRFVDGALREPKSNKGKHKEFVLSQNGPAGPGITVVPPQKKRHSGAPQMQDPSYLTGALANGQLGTPRPPVPSLSPTSQQIQLPPGAQVIQTPAGPSLYLPSVSGGTGTERNTRRNSLSASAIGGFMPPVPGFENSSMSQNEWGSSKDQTSGITAAHLPAGWATGKSSAHGLPPSAKSTAAALPPSVAPAYATAPPAGAFAPTTSGMWGDVNTGRSGPRALPTTTDQSFRPLSGIWPAASDGITMGQLMPSPKMAPHVTPRNNIQDIINENHAKATLAQPTVTPRTTRSNIMDIANSSPAHIITPALVPMIPAVTPGRHIMDLASNNNENSGIGGGEGDGDGDDQPEIIPTGNTKKGGKKKGGAKAKKKG